MVLSLWEICNFRGLILLATEKSSLNAHFFFKEITDRLIHNSQSRILSRCGINTTFLRHSRHLSVDYKLKNWPCQILKKSRLWVDILREHLYPVYLDGWKQRQRSLNGSGMKKSSLLAFSQVSYRVRSTSV